MLKTLLLCCFVSFSCIVIAQKPEVKSIVNDRYTVNNSGDWALSLQIKQEFNTFNKIALQEYYYPDNKGNLQLDRQVRYSYDPKGRHLNTLEYNGDGILESETKLHWDEYNNKNKVEQIEYTDGKQVSVAVTYQLEYDSEGNKKNERNFDANGNEVSGKTWYYNNQKEVIKSYSWVDNKKEPKTETYSTFKRDKSGYLVKSISKEKVNGKIFRKDVHFFNNNYVIEWKKYIHGKLESHFINEYRDSVIIRTTRHNTREIISLEEDQKRQDKLEKNKDRNRKKDKNEEIWVTNTEYDTYGNILVTSQSINGTVVLVTQYTYDDYGNKIKTIKFNKEKDIKEEEHLAYDEWGSIIKRTNLLNGKKVSEDTYKFEYFPKE